MTIFLIGPSAGYFDGNRKGFTEAAGTLRGHGFTVVDPRQMDDISDEPSAVLRAMLSCEALAVMPGWRKDDQARLLVAVAASAGYQIVTLPDMADLDPSLVPPLRV